jgi:hypothetical protein
MTEFFEELNTLAIRYVILRWFEDLPEIGAGEDLDVLVLEDDASKIAALLSKSERREAIPLDVYSTQGRFHSGHAGIAYYPPARAEQIINRSELHPSGARVPNLEDYFHSLAFHALYHKGYAAAIPIDEQSPSGMTGEHDYATVLAKLAHRLDLTVPITMTGLDRYLADVGWRPPLDTIAKWSLNNEWCRQMYQEGLADIDAPDGLVVAIVREAAAESISEITELLQVSGLEVTEVRKLERGAAERAAQQLRGGNWGQGLYPTSAGKPYAVIIAIDHDPITPTSEQTIRYPGIDNARINLVKSTVRDWWNKQVIPSQRCNIVHTSDSAAQAVHYLAVLGITLDRN